MAGCDDVTVRHNVFHWSGVDSIQAWGAADARYRITHNILLDGVPSYKSNPAIWVAPEKVPNLVCDGNLHWRETSHKMALLGFSPQGGAPVTIRCDTFEQVRELGYETRGAYAAPLFIDTSNSDYRLQPGSPAMGMGSGGTTVGIRFRADTQ